MIPRWINLEDLKSDPIGLLSEVLKSSVRLSRYVEVYGDMVLSEMHFIKSSKLRQIAGADNLKDALNLLEDTKYAFLNNSINMDEVEEKMRYNLIEEVTNSPLDNFAKHRISYIYRYWDFENLKIALKSHVLKINPELGMSLLGKQFFNIVSKKGVKALRGTTFYDIGKQALRLYHKYKDPIEIDLFIDKMYFNNVPLSLRNHYSSWIDVENMKMYLRLKNNMGLFRKAFIPKGKYSFRFYEDGIVDKEFEDLFAVESPSLREWKLDLLFLNDVYERGLYDPMSFNFSMGYFVRRLFEVKMLDFLLSTRGYIVDDVLDYVKSYEQVMRL